MITIKKMLVKTEKLDSYTVLVELWIGTTLEHINILATSSSTHKFI